MRKSSCWSLSLAVLIVSGAGCGMGADGDTNVTTIEGHQTTSQSSFLVSFTGGGIPANASSLVGAAGGTIVARYNAVGAVLARSSSASFATKLRGTAGVEDVGNVASVHSSIPMPNNSGARPPHKPRPPGGGDPLSPRQWDMDQIHAPQARAITSGKPSVIAGVIDSGVDITHPDLAGRVDLGASASCVGGIADPSPALWTNDVFGHGTYTSGQIDVSTWAPEIEAHFVSWKSTQS